LPLADTRLGVKRAFTQEHVRQKHNEAMLGMDIARAAASVA
jgi:hypothetical protein